MTREQAEALARTMLDGARQIGKSSGTVMPAFEIVPHDGVPLVMLVPFESQEQKDMAFRLVNLACVARDARAMVFVSECWMSSGPLPAGVTPSTSDTRIEAVQTATSYYDDVGGLAHFIITREIQRDADGAWSDLGPEKIASAIGGAATRILPPRRATTAERMEAIRLLQQMQPNMPPARETIQ